MHIPTATYRVQFNKDFTLNDLDAIIDYLQALGISTIYASPITCAVPGSLHGYDVTDPHRLNPEIGTPEQFKLLTGKLKEKGMGWIQDIVPNHMAFSTHNYRLMDVLERGPSSPYYTYFDIDWNHPDEHLRGKLMTPVLEQDLDACLQQQALQLTGDTNEGFIIQYAGNRYPLSLPAIPVLTAACKPGNSFSRQLAVYQNVAAITAPFPEWQEAKKKLLKSFDTCKEQMEQCLARINGNPQLLHQLLKHQYYTFTYHGDTSRQINYRRFFTVNSLICLDMEREETLLDYHQWLVSLYREGYIQGLRIDHLDGLSNPAQYLQRLRKLFGEDCYIIVEKILEAGEKLPPHWPIQGTSGYEFLAHANRLLTPQEGAEKLLQQYKQINPQPYEELVQEKKQLILQKYMGGELENLVSYFFSLAPSSAEINRERFRQALALFMTRLPVYRIYAEELPLTGYSRQVIQQTFDSAQQAIAGTEAEWNLLQKIFEEGDAILPPTGKLLFIKRLMQFTGPLTAKGVEDTTFYVYNAFIAHNEVGDSPDVPAINTRHFHAKMLERQQQNPLSLNATATHDTKRGEDARLRITVLGEWQPEWQQRVNGWQTINKPFVTMLKGEPAPSRNDEYFIYQSLVGGFPVNFSVTPEYIGRLKNYLVKAMREAKVNSAWDAPEETYEDACCRFVEKILQDDHSFLAGFIPFLRRVVRYAIPFSLNQLVIKITAPGIPDIYQGCELWDLSYVDPDNRRPVDYTHRLVLLQELEQKEKESTAAAAKWAIDQYETALSKLWVMKTLLHVRKEYNRLFIHGEYIPLYAADNDNALLAFIRRHRQEWLLVLLPLKMVTQALPALHLPLPAEAPRRWQHVFTGETMEGHCIHVQAAFKKFPVAVLKPLE